MRTGRDGQQLSINAVGVGQVLGLLVLDGQQPQSLEPVGTLRVLAKIVVDDGCHLGGLGGLVVGQGGDHQVVHVLAVADRSGLAVTVGGIGPLTKATRVLAHHQVELSLAVRSGRQPSAQQLRRRHVALGPLVAASPLGHGLESHFFGRNPLGKNGRQFSGQGRGTTVDRLVVDRCELLDSRHRVTSSNRRSRAATVNGQVSHRRGSTIGVPVEDRGQTNLDAASRRILRVSLQPLTPGGDEIAVTTGCIQTVDELQQDVVVTRVGGMRGDKSAAHANQTKQTTVLMIQVDQLGHHVGRFTRRVLELPQFALKTSRLLTDRVDFTSQLGRVGSRRLGVLSDQYTDQTTGHTQADHRRSHRRPMCDKTTRQPPGPPCQESLGHRPHLVISSFAWHVRLNHRPAPSPAPLEPEASGAGVGLGRLSRESASEIFLASLARGLSGNSWINWSNFRLASGRRFMRYRHRP